MRGSFTVEAALDFGCVVLCLIFCVYMALYMHDKSVLEGAAVCAAQRGRLYVTESQIMDEGKTDWDVFERKSILWRLTGSVSGKETAGYAERLVEGRLLVCVTPIFNVSMGTDKVTVTYNAKTLLNGVYISGTGFAVPQISGAVTDSGMEPEEFVRLVKAIAEEAAERRE